MLIRNPNMPHVPVYQFSLNSTSPIIGRLNLRHCGYIAGVEIDFIHRNKGYGTQMMLELVAFVKQNNFKKLILNVQSRNIPAIRVYTKVGFVKDVINSSDNIHHMICNLV